MKFYYVTFRSVTFAQKAERVLKRSGVDCTIQRTPKELSQRGCGYCIRLRPGQAMRAKQLLDAEKLDYGKVYAVRADGGIEELHL